MDEQNKLAPFEGKEIRQVWHNEQWYFAINDIIQVLVETDNPRQYWTKVKNNLLKESELQPFWLQLKVKSKDGKNYKTDCANTEGVLRIVMSVPSPKAEPLKQWMAQVSTERIQETENPELGFERMAEIYKAKGYSDEWIKERLQSIQTRKRLTDEWQKRDVQQGQEYSILTAIIAKGTFGLNPSEHKKLKGLEKPSHELRDHMTPMELILTAFSEEATRQIAIRDDAKGFNENQEAAQLGGKIGGNARENFEKTTGLKVVSTENFLPASDKPQELSEGDKKA